MKTFFVKIKIVESDTDDGHKTLTIEEYEIKAKDKKSAIAEANEIIGNQTGYSIMSCSDTDWDWNQRGDL